MESIRLFEAERRAWEVLREDLERRVRQADQRTEALEAEKWDAEHRCGRLATEVDALRRADAWPRAPPPQPRPGRLESAHESQLTLAVAVDELRDELLQARQRAAEAEQGQGELRAELDRLRWKEAAAVAPGPPDSAWLRGELLEARRELEQKRRDVVGLEDELLGLRGQLNAEKQKVLELKRDALSRRAAWQEELGKITDELGATGRLEEENSRLRADSARWRGALEQATGRAEELQRELEQAKAAKPGAAELSLEEGPAGAGGPPPAAADTEPCERERATSRLLGLFLQHSRGPAQTLRRSCRRAVDAGEAGDELRPRQAPPIFEADVRHLQDNLVKLVDLLRYFADVHDAMDRQTTPSTSCGGSTSECSPAQSVLAGATIASKLEETVSYAANWLRLGIA